MKTVTIKIEYEQGKCTCEMWDDDIPPTIVLRMITSLKENLENTISEQAEVMGVSTQEGFDEYLENRTTFELSKLKR